MAVYACSDLHGRMDLYKEIKKHINPEDIVYFLGDAADRGPDGWELIKTILRDTQFIYLKGNHEDMLVNAAREWFDYDSLDHAAWLLFYNGGEKTFEDFRNDNADFQHNWIRLIDNLPEYKCYVNSQGETIHLSHAGFTYIENINPELNDLIWNRTHIFDDKPIPDGHFVIHGHTPISSMRRRVPDVDSPEPGAFWYHNGSKCCIDNASFNTGITCLLNLDTFDEEIIQIEYEENC